MLYEYRLETPKEGFIDITNEVRDACRQSGVFDGMLTVYCPHTTAGVTINENTDPEAKNDLLLALNKTYPYPKREVGKKPLQQPKEDV
jgi:secondary thiamine-phosphate synthase enzyme